MYSKLHDRLPAPVFLGGSADKESACNGGDLGSMPGLRKIPWRKEWLSTPVFLPGEFHGQKRLGDGSLCGCEESDIIG